MHSRSTKEPPAGDGVERRQARRGRASKVVDTLKAVGSFCLANWLIFGFGFVTLMAYLFPHVAAKGGIIRSEYSILYGAVALIFFINAMQLPPAKLREHFANWRLHLVVQGINLVIIPIIQLVLVHIVIAAGGVSSGTIDPSILVGMIVAGCIPTTIASNVVMTRNSGGDEAACIIEVVVGNVVGSFLAPWMIYAFIPAGPEFDPLRPASTATLGPMYATVMQQLGLSVLVPLVVGQILRWTWPKQVLWALNKFYLGKFCSLLLVTLVWSTFSGAFETGAIYRPSKSSIAFNICLNVAEYILFTAICFYAASPPRAVMAVVNPAVADSKAGARLPPVVRRALTVKRMAPEQVVAVCFAGAAKTTSLGIPLSAAMWSQLDNFTIALIQVPVVLYTVEQVFIAQFLTIFFKRWLQKAVEAEGGSAGSGSAGELHSPPGSAFRVQQVEEGGAEPVKVVADPEKGQARA